MSEQVFKHVWFKPDFYRFSNMRGQLIVRADSVEFQGKKERVVISQIRRISNFSYFGVKIEYGDEAPFQTALVSVQGISLIRGNRKRILDAMQHLVGLNIEQSGKGEGITTVESNRKSYRATVRYAIEPSSPKRLAISFNGFWKNINIQFDGQSVGSIPRSEDLKAGQEFRLPDDSVLKVQLVGSKLYLHRDGIPIPNSGADPAQNIKGAATWFFMIAGLSLVYSIIFLLGGHWAGGGFGLALTQFVDNTAVRTATTLGSTMGSQVLGIAKTIAFAIDIGIISVFVALGILAQKKQNWGFIITGMILYALDGIIFLLYGIFIDAFMHLVALIFIYRWLRAGRKQIAVINPSHLLIKSKIQEEANTENPVTTDQYQTPSHSFRGILSCLLPFIILCVVIVNYPTFFLMGTPAGSFFLYCISPVGLLIGFVLSVSELRKKNQKRFFPILGIIIMLIAVAPILLEWTLGLMQGVPFSCLENPTFCGW